MITHPADDDQATSEFPVDSTLHHCRQGIGRRTPDCNFRAPTGSAPTVTDLLDYPETQCAPWCVSPDHVSHDPACWGTDNYVNLTMEEGYPHEALPGMAHHFDPPRIGVNSYRARPGWRSGVLLHLYRPSENDHIDMDANLQLAADEARQLAAMLIAVAEEIQ